MNFIDRSQLGRLLSLGVGLRCARPAVVGLGVEVGGPHKSEKL